MNNNILQSIYQIPVSSVKELVPCFEEACKEGNAGVKYPHYYCISTDPRRRFMGINGYEIHYNQLMDNVASLGHQYLMIITTE